MTGKSTSLTCETFGFAMLLSIKDDICVIFTISLMVDGIKLQISS